VLGNWSAGSTANLVKRGSTTRPEHVKETSGFPIEISSALGVSETAWRMRMPRETSPSSSDRLYRLARIFALAEEVLEDREQAREWLRSPQVGLNNRVPFVLMETEAGAREVEDLLLRIEHGVLS
jgi:putative toxin-antitoxin system antitoxin component (TIGR02293 family)